MDKLVDIDEKIRKGLKKLVEFCSVASTGGPKYLEWLPNSRLVL